MSTRHPWVSLIQSHITIVDYIGRDEQLRRRGTGVYEGEHAAASHTSKSKTCLSVFPEDDTFTCNNCGAKGDIVSYVQDRDGLDFVNACETLARELGIELPEGHAKTDAEKAVARAIRDRKRLTVSLMDAACDYYHAALTPAAIEYFHRRGISDESIGELRLGYADKSRRGLVKHLYSVAKQAQPDIDDATAKTALLGTGLFFATRRGTLSALYCQQYLFWYFNDVKRQTPCYSIGRAATEDSEKKYQKQYYAQAFVDTTAVQHILWNKAELTGELPVLVVEGIIDAILARQVLSEDYDVISPVTTRINATDLSNLFNILKRTQPRKVVFCNDSEINSAGATGALESAEKLSTELYSFYETHAKSSEQKVTDKQAASAAELAMPDIRIATLPRPPEVDKIDVADYLAAGKHEAVTYWLKAARTLPQMRDWLEDNPRRFFEGRAFIPKRVSDELRTEGYYLHVGDRLHVYRQGVYRYEKGFVEAQIESKLQEMWKAVRADEVCKHLKIRVICKPDAINPPDLVNFKNGILTDLGAAVPTLQCHSPEHLSTLQIDANWDMRAAGSDVDIFYEFLLSLVAEPDIPVVKEMIGYCMLSSATLHKAFVLLGKGRNGKSTLLRVMSELLGAEENVCTLSLQDLQENRFATAGMFGKAANLYPDMSLNDIRNANIFKSIVAGDKVLAERKFTDSFEFRVSTTQVLSVNAMPRIYDTTKGLFRRLLLIEFPYHFGEPTDALVAEGVKVLPERDMDEVVAEVLKARDGIATLCLISALAAVARREFTITEKSQQLLLEYRQESSPELVFFDEILIKADTRTDALPKKELYAAYQKWLEENESNRRPLSQNKLSRALKNHFGTAVQEDRIVVNGKQVRAWNGIQIAPDVDLAWHDET